MENLLTDIIGYVAMTLLVVSFFPKQLKILRSINLVACLFFVAYGVLLNWAWPIIISNFAVACVQFYHLFIIKSHLGTAEK